MKNIINISLSLFLALNIVLGYTGITVFKMICATEKGKIFTSMVNVKRACEHNKAKAGDCCKPASKQNEEIPLKGCCDYSYAHIQLDDDSRIEQQVNSTNHYLQCITLNGFAPLCITPYQLASDLAVIQNPPPLLSLRKQPFQAFTQSYLI